ncbi:MAG: HEAT repeat domain-containing protein [Nitrospinota bacterium]|nr:HEAT repeat domain-containing protein [Nitrospinota bacterium]
MSKKLEAADAIALCLKGKLAMTRMAAIQALGTIGVCSSMKDLLGCLNDPDPDVRIDAAEVLGKIQNKDALEPLLDVTKAIDGDLVINAVRSLGQISDRTDKKVVDRLIQMLEDDDAVYRPDEDLEDEMDFDPSWDVHLEAVRALGRIGDPKAVDPLVKYLTDEFAQDISHDIFRALISIKDEAAVDILIKLLKDSDDLLRKRIAGLLGDVDHPKAVEVLTNTLLDKNADVRISAAGSLVKIGDPQNILVPLALLLKDQDQEVRAEVVGLFAQIDNPRVIEHLLPMLKDPVRNVRKKAAEVLGSLRTSEAVDPLLELLKKSDESVQCEVIRSLGRIGDKKALEPLYIIIEDIKKEAYTRITAIHAVTRIGGPEILEVLKKSIESNEKEIILSAMVALEKVGLPEARSIIISVFDEPEDKKDEDEVQSENDSNKKEVNPVEHLSNEINPENDKDKTRENKESDIKTNGEVIPEVRHEKLVDPLMANIFPASKEEKDEHAAEEKEIAEKDQTIDDNCADEKAEVAEDKAEDEGIKIVQEKYKKTFAARVLGNISIPESIDVLISLLDNDDLDLVIEAIISLGNMQKKELFINIEPFLNHEQRELRLAALEALGKIKNEDAIEPLCKILKEDEDPFIRETAVSSLGQIGTPKALETFLEALKDESREVRRQAVVNLGKFKEGKAIELLLGSLYDYENFGELRDEIAKSLKSIGKPEIVDQLIDVIKNNKQQANHWIAMAALMEIYRKAA